MITEIAVSTLKADTRAEYDALQTYLSRLNLPVPPIYDDTLRTATITITQAHPTL